MCGICGWLSWERAPDPEIVRAMSETIIHRGPDAGGVRALGPMVLGHRRLSIIDLAASNDQPLSDHEGRAWIAFNGEIYNFRRVRRELESLGHRFRTHGDTEVILEAWKRWGEGCLERLEGMFAFALWDVPTQTLLLARDRLGEKPLFWAEVPAAQGGGVIFASEPKALLAHPGLARGVDPIGLGDFLSLNYTLGTTTLFKGVSRLEAAHVMTLSRGSAPRVRRYWDLAEVFRRKEMPRRGDDGVTEDTAATLRSAEATHSRPSERDLAEQLAARIDAVVAERMVSDVPLGAFLSGGVDSSTIVAAMTRAGDPSSVKTFTIGFEEKGYDEVAEAREVAMLLGIDHRDRTQTADAESVIRALTVAGDEPLADTSLMPTWFLSQFTREFVTVSLSGDGGDELFAGYETYAADRLHRRVRHIPRPLLGALRWGAEHLVPTTHGKVSFDYKLRQFLAGAELPFRRAHWWWRVIFGPESMRSLLRPDHASRVTAEHGFSEFDRHFREVDSCHWLDQASYVDIKTWMVDDILVKVDRATMAHSLESRAPFLDSGLVEFAAALPPSMKMRGSRKKHLLKESQRGRLPSTILDRKKKGFNAPVSSWFDGALKGFVRDALAEPALREWFEPAAIDTLVREHADRIRDHGLRLLSLVSFSLWLRRLNEPLTSLSARTATKIATTADDASIGSSASV
ncbi:MAG: asparagine synthase (glutamine-hydrolyzing) [Phycisphaeraceae bacterium]|nr:asparagine synthase (glutamine-hydrolyzing) [Phycisphaeraceae bacterium]